MILDYNLAKHKNEKDVLLSVISHPKAMGDYHIQLMRDFINLVKTKYADRVEFTSFESSYAELKNKKILD